MVRPKNAGGEKVILDGNEKAKYRSSEEIITTTDTKTVVTAAGRGIGTLIKLLLGFVLVLVALYLGLSSTLMGAFSLEATTDDQGEEKTEWVWVTRNVFVGGIPESGDQALISTTSEVSTTYLDKFMQTFRSVPDPAVVEVVAGPFGAVSSPNGEILLDQNPTGYAFSVDNHTLNRQYVVVCVTGACTPDTAYVIHQDQIAGRADGMITKEGIKPYEKVK